MTTSRQFDLKFEPGRACVRGIATQILLCVAFALALGGSAQVLQAAEIGADIPSLIESKTGTRYAWVSTTRVVNPDGEVNYEYFLESSPVADKIERAPLTHADSLGKVADLATEDCNSFYLMSRRYSYAENASDFVGNARLVFSGQIVAVDQGFSDGFSGTLLKVQVTEMMKNTAGYEIESYAYVFYPYSRFSINGAQFCQGNFPELYWPKPGDRVLVFSYATPFDMANQFVWAEGSEVLFEDAESGRVINNILLKETVELNAGAAKDKDKDSLKLWGDDLPDFRTLCKQVRAVVAERAHQDAGER